MYCLRRVLTPTHPNPVSTIKLVVPIYIPPRYSARGQPTPAKAKKIPPGGPCAGFGGGPLRRSLSGGPCAGFGRSVGGPCAGFGRSLCRMRAISS